MQIKNLRGVIICAFNGATLTVADSNGEVLGTLDLTPGVVDLTPLQPLAAAGEVHVQGAYLLQSPFGRNIIMTSDKKFQSAAAKTYTPSLAEEQEMHMRRLVSKFVAEERTKEDQRAERVARKKLKGKIEDEPTPTPPAGDTPPSGGTGDNVSDEENDGANGES